jgi:hypothetical protein
MALITGVFPYDVDNLLGSAARVLLSDDATALPAVPADISDVILMKSPYTAQTGWVDIGATTEGATYEREIEKSGFEIEQSQTAVLETIESVERGIEFTMGEIKVENLKIMEGAATTSTIAAATGASAQKAVKFGNINALAKRRCVFLGQRHPGSGIVDEGGTAPTIKRGRFVMLALYNVELAAESSEVELAKGELAGVPLNLKAFPEGGQPSGQEIGVWLTEDAGTIT